MTKKLVVELIDDCDGLPADETVRFTFEGFEYSLDLTSSNAQRLRADLQPWMDVASERKKAGKARKASKTRARRRTHP